MAYTSNPFIPNVRRMAVNDVDNGMSYSSVSFKYGVSKSCICKWIKKYSLNPDSFMETLSSRPHSHPNQLDVSVVERIVNLRKEIGRCAPVIHKHMLNEGYSVSLSSVGRVLKREGLTRRRKPAKWHDNIKRPPVFEPGDLAQMDTIHISRSNYSKFYIYTIIDIFSRLAFAQYSPRIRQTDSLIVVNNAINYFGFTPKVIQTDNGSEFKTGFSTKLRQQQIKVRHSRVRKPNDNAHIERFNRTIQEECFQTKYPKEHNIQKQITEYIEFYNTKRLHLGLDLTSPRDFVSKLLN